MSFSVEKSELRTGQLAEIWLNPDERCYGHEKKRNVIPVLSLMPGGMGGRRL